MHNTLFILYYYLLSSTVSVAGFIQAIFGRDDVNISVDITTPIVNRDPDYIENIFNRLNSYSKRFLYCIIYLKLCDLCSFVLRKQLSRLNLLIAGGTLNETLGY